MLASDSEAGKRHEKHNYAPTYTDEIFRRYPQVYVDFIKEMFERGMVELRPSAKSVITPFFVAKKNNKLRLVLDCRSANQHFSPPPDIALAAGIPSTRWAFRQVSEVSLR